MSPVTFCSLFGPHLLVSVTDTHSLTCDIIVKDPATPLDSWCEGQCSVDGEPCLQYDNDNKATPLGDLGKVADATPVWTDLMQKLEYLGQELRKMLANSIQEMTETSGKCGIKYRGRNNWQERGRAEHMWEWDGECVCERELSTGPTLEACGTQWVTKDKSCGNDPGS